MCVPTYSMPKNCGMYMTIEMVWRSVLTKMYTGERYLIIENLSCGMHADKLTKV